MSYFFSTRSGTTYTIETFPITSIHALSNNYQKRVRPAESLCSTRTQKQTDLEYE